MPPSPPAIMDYGARKNQVRLGKRKKKLEKKKLSRLERRGNKKTKTKLDNLLQKEKEGTLTPEFYSNVTEDISNIYKNYNPALEEEVALKMWDLYKDKTPQQFVLALNNLEITKGDIENSPLLSDLKKDESILKDQVKFLNLLKNDALVNKVGQITAVYYSLVSAPRIAFQERIDAKMKAYMKAQLDFMKDEKTFFPDANSTLRVTYGKVDGYEPRDAVKYEPKTYLGGVIEKYVPGDYEFDVSDKLIDLYNKKDYGIYGENGKMPVNFIATNHTTGGNSGSPTLDANGNLIGLNFDRVWEGTMSDLYYDPKICRNIMVDARYILFVIDKYANAKRLINEMKIIK